MSAGSTSSSSSHNSHVLDIDAFTSLLMANVAKDSNNNTNSTGPVLPAAAIGPKIPAKGYLVQQIRGGLYWLTALPISKCKSALKVCTFVYN